MAKCMRNLAALRTHYTSQPRVALLLPTRWKLAVAPTDVLLTEADVEIAAVAYSTMGTAPASAATTGNMPLPSTTAAPPRAEGSGDGTSQQQALEERVHRLAEAAARAFRRQRDRLSALRLLTSWRHAAVRERSKREALSRLMRNYRTCRLRGNFERWRVATRAMRWTVQRQKEVAVAATEAAAVAGAAAEEVAVTAKAAEAAMAAKTVAEKLVHERERELQHEKATMVELQNTVEGLRAEVSVRG